MQSAPHFDRVSDNHTEMAEALRNLQHVVSQCHDSVFITDPAGILLRVNPAFERLSGYTSLEIVGKDFSAIIAGGADSECYRQLWSEIFQQKVFFGVLEIAQKGGNVRRVEVTVTPVRSVRGRVSSLVGTGRAVAEENGQEQSTSTPKASDISAELRHNLNNALMLIGGHAELALAGLRHGDPLCRSLQEIAVAARRASCLAHELLSGGSGATVERAAFPQIAGANTLPFCPATELHVPPDAEKSPKTQRTVLIVEDEALIRESTVEFLSRTGYRVLSAASGEDALERMHAHAGAIDVVVTDVVLPQMSGQQLADKTAAAHPEATVLFISGYAEAAVLRKGDADSTKHFLQKPFSLRALADKIDQVLMPAARARAAGAAS